MSDRVFVRGLELSGTVGVFEEEKTVDQRYLVDIDAYMDLREAGRKDALESTVDYGSLCRLARRALKSCSGKNLLECFADELANQIMESMDQVSAIRIRVRKPDVEIDDFRFESVGVEIQRSR